VVHSLLTDATKISQDCQSCGRLTAKCHGYIISDKAMRVRMLHCELKWEIPAMLVIDVRTDNKCIGGDYHGKNNGCVPIKFLY